MRRPILGLALALAAAGAAAAAPPLTGKPPGTTIQCIEAGGRAVPATCQVPASRLDPVAYICTCLDGGQRVEVAICARGQTPPPEGRALNVARREAIRDGSLVGDTVAGRPICEAPRDR
ncbi:MAG: hypothetical protein JNK30_01085 [Phenylobacterium sp.]|uniref:hypothetical protein n=1 Tax=Phenylobacterium sp. TaxID=1871053 RepID=UPI001A5C7B6B|nr:hypothetical protein [Phenylobacterium sp.]MBL8769948.1 hypothetical protein [Phenylobacterium sp.]